MLVYNVYNGQFEMMLSADVDGFLCGIRQQKVMYCLIFLFAVKIIPLFIFTHLNILADQEETADIHLTETNHVCRQ